MPRKKEKKPKTIEELAVERFTADNIREPGPGDDLDAYRIQAIIERLEG